jgi:serine/threonine protein kinase
MEDWTDKNLGNYQIVEEMERGRMTAVYGALDMELQHLVALRILPEYFRRHPTLIQRFRQEAIQAANLDLPNIIAIFEAGEDERRLCFAIKYTDLQRSSNKMPIPWF